jgi:hypothetical protein
MTEQQDPPVIDCTLSEDHLNALEFLFNDLPSRVTIHDLENFEFVAQQARRGVVRIEPHKDYSSGLVFTNYVGDASILGTYRGPLFVTRNLAGEISVDLTYFDSKGHQPSLVPALRTLLDEVMAPPARADQVDMSLHYQAARNRIDNEVFNYLWQRKQFSSYLRSGLTYTTGVRENWTFIEFTLGDGVVGDDNSGKRFAIGIMGTHSIFRGPALHHSVRMFEVDDVFMEGYQPIGLIDDPAIIPAIKARVDEIKDAMHRALLETDIL